MKWGVTAISNILPEGSVKEILRRYFWNYYFLHCMNKVICEVKLSEDGSLFVELKEGTKLYAQQEGGIGYLIKPVHPRNLGRIKEPECLRLAARLYDQYVVDVYQKYYKLKKGDIIMDLGAHIGVFTVKAAKAVGDEGIVIAVEPEPDNLRFLRRNVEANQLKNVTIIDKGIWGTKDRIKLFIGKSTAMHSLLRHEDALGFVEIEVDTLDNILRELGINKVDFIKMDIEGAEIEALNGMKETLRDNDVKLAVAAYHGVGGEPSYKTVAPWLKGSGFHVYAKKGIVYGMKKPSL